LADGGLPTADPVADAAVRARTAATRRLRDLLPTSGAGGPLGAALLLVVLSCALFSSQLAPRSPFALEGDALQAPSAAHPMGTDNLGRDIYSGVVHGARASSVIAVTSAVVIGVVGLGVGVLAGYRGGLVDDLLMRCTELVQVLPRFFLAIIVVALFGPGIDRIVLVLGLTSWPELARIARAEVLSLREQEYVDSARALGAGPFRIVVRHILPGVFPISIAFLALAVAQVLLVEASLGFIGLSDPSVMTWGLLAGNAREFIRSAWWLAVFPGLAIAVAVLGLNLTGDAVSARLGGRRSAE
jgi:peptide/nickel transport system permease protein